MTGRPAAALHTLCTVIGRQAGCSPIFCTAEAFVYSDWKVSARVSIDYHIELHGHYYSLLYALIHEAVDARLTAKYDSKFDVCVEVPLA